MAILMLKMNAVVLPVAIAFAWAYTRLQDSKLPPMVKIAIFLVIYPTLIGAGVLALYLAGLFPLPER